MTRIAVQPPAPSTFPTDQPETGVRLHRVICVGRNYADHAREMGNDPDREPPFFFLKPAGAVVPSGRTIPYPPATDDLHHEAELAVLIGTGGADIAPERALAHVWGQAAANDLTRRDLQARAKQMRRPWDMAKGFDNSAVLGTLHNGADLDGDRSIRCRVDGALRQEAPLSAMIWPVAEIIAHLSRLLTLQPGDLILTGTPAGVGPIARGQTCTVEIDGLTPATVTLD
ncbi:fumarylacetoacetate hydrolase family protein [Salibaculum halophilum]|uniref:fumarylacetoacetate hydrolase family protein n=1 Tax=Salibaculum halophilum TaxID=1914408 RepID=UPI000A0F8B6D|nr:fumarylacetoacetate hydrolase family protein [Salibaculum halophilum]